MLNISSEHMAALGDAVMLVDEDTIYISSGKWLIVTSGADHYFTSDVLEILNDAPDGTLVDWRVINAKEVFAEAKKFVPDRGARALDIYLSADKYAMYQRFTAETVRELLSENQNIWEEPLYNLTDLFGGGAARVQYQRPDPTSSRFAPEPTAHIYTFDLDGRILGVNAKHFKAFYEMEFGITCPTNVGRPDFLGMMQRDNEPDVFGMLVPLLKIGVHTHKDRELYLDVAQVSWEAPESGLQALRKYTSYTPGSRSTATTLVQRNASNSLVEGVAILRWHGLSDVEIDTLHREGKEGSLQGRKNELLRQLQGYVDLFQMEPKEWSLREVTLNGMERELQDLELEGFVYGASEKEAIAWIREHMKGPRRPG